MQETFPYLLHSKSVVIVTVMMMVVACALLPATGQAQAQKPSAALRQVEKMAESLDRDLDDGRVRPDELEVKAEAIVRFAAQQAAPYKIADWDRDELYALAMLYQRAELFAPAGQAFREYLKGKTKEDKALDAQVGLVRALLETEKFDDAALAMEQLERRAPVFRRGYVPLLVARIALRKDLAVIFYDREEYEKATAQARAGARLMWSLGDRDMMDPLNREARDYDRAALGAIVVMSLVRQEKIQEAQDYKRRLEQVEFASDPRLLAIFQSELTAANLINQSAGSVKFQYWLNGQPFTSDVLRGKVLILHFWAMWSNSSTQAFPHLRNLLGKYGSQDLVVLGVTRFYGRSDVRDDLKPQQELTSMQEFLKRHDISYPVAIAPEDDLTNDDKFSVYSLPTIIVIDRNGKVRLIRRGVGNWAALEKQIAKFVEGK